MKCSEIGNSDMLQPRTTGTSMRDEVGDTSDDEDSPSLHLSNELEGRSYGNYEQLLRTAVISILIFWVFISLGVVIYDAASHHLPS